MQERRAPETAPEVPSWAERMMILPHVRVQYHPLLLNELGGPLADGPREYLGIDLRCPICREIQPLGPPGKDNRCRACNLNYKYTAVKGACWLWIWKDREKLTLDPQNVFESNLAGPAQTSPITVIDFGSSPGFAEGSSSPSIGGEEGG